MHLPSQPPATQTGYNQIDIGRAPGFTPPSSVAQNGATVYGLLPGRQQDSFDHELERHHFSGASVAVGASKSPMSPTRARTNGSTAATARSGIKTTYSYGGFFLPDPTGSNTGGATYGMLMSPNAPACTSSTPTNNQPLACAGPYGANYKLTLQRERLPSLECLPGRLPALSRQLRELQFAAGVVAKTIRPGHLPDELHLQQGTGHHRWTDRQRAGNGTVVDPFNIRNNYGPLAYDHTHILNFSYVWNMPKFIHGNRFSAAR